jgi:flagellar motor switch protein FliN/FliY
VNDEPDPEATQQDMSAEAQQPTGQPEAQAPKPPAPVEPSAKALQAKAMPLPDLGQTRTAIAERHGLDLLNDVELNVKIELGRSKMRVEDVLRLGKGSVVELDKLAGDPVDVLVNDRLVARGEVLVLSDCFCVRINEIVSPNERGATSAPA